MGFRGGKGYAVYSKGERVKRPAPEVLDADGVPIKVGETVWDTNSGLEITVWSIMRDEDDNTMVYSCGDICGLQLVPRHLTHVRPVLDADGKPIKVGDTVYEVETGLKSTVTSTTMLDSDGNTVCCKDNGTGELHYRPEELTHKEPVLCADGKPIKEGETVWHEDGTELRVDAIMNEGQDNGAGFERLVRVTYVSGPTDWDTVRSLSLSHTPPDTQENINADSMKDQYDYWDCEGYGCGACPAKTDGKTPRKFFGVDSCCKAMTLDLLRRQRELDARMGGKE